MLPGKKMKNADCFCTSHVLQMHCMIAISDGLCGVFRLHYRCIRISTYNAAIVPGHQGVKYLLYPLTILWLLHPVEIHSDGTDLHRTSGAHDVSMTLRVIWISIPAGAMKPIREAECASRKGNVGKSWQKGNDGSCSSSHCSRWLV